MRPIFAILAFTLASLTLHGQTSIQPDPPHRDWQASWITHPTAPLREPIVLHFRRTLDPRRGSIQLHRPRQRRQSLHPLRQRPARRRRPRPRRPHPLALREIRPRPAAQARRQPHHRNRLELRRLRPVAQFTDRTAFLLESEATGDASISTPEDWQVEVEPGHRPLGRNTVTIQDYMASGPGEQIDAAHYDWNWTSPPRPAQPGSPPPHPCATASIPGVNQAHSADTAATIPGAWCPTTLPHMEYPPTSAGETVRDRIRQRSSAFPATPGHRSRRQPRPHPARPQNPHHRLPPAHRLRRQRREHPPHLLGSPLRQRPATKATATKSPTAPPSA